MIALQIIFWICVLSVFHSYVLFPLILKLLDKKTEKTLNQEYVLPTVSILISAYNEESVIEQKINSIFDSTYPPEKIEVIVGSDCSTDNTNSIMGNLAQRNDRISFIPFIARQGKSNIINQLVEKTSGTILILTDANVMFSPDTITELVKPFSDEKIGLVDTHMVNTNLKKEGISIQEKSYISREVIIKNREGNIWGSMMGPFGGCYAIRKVLYRPVPVNLLVDDFYISMNVLKQNYSTINNLNAIVYEDVSNDLSIEFRRKVRIATGDFQNLHIFFNMLFSRNSGAAFSFLSHKVLRWLGPLFLLTAFVMLSILAFDSNFYLLLLIIYGCSFLLPLLDYILKKSGIHSVYLRFFTHFYTMNVALLIGLFKAIIGVKNNVWKPTKRFQ